MKYGGLITDLLFPECHAEYKDNIFLSAKISGLSKDSVVITPQIGAVPKASLVEKVSKLSPSMMKEVDRALTDFLKL